MGKRRTKKAVHRQRDAGDSTAPTLSFWLVAFMDMLGYRSVLKRMDVFPLPEDVAAKAELQAELAEAVAVRRNLLAQLDTFQDGLKKIHPVLDDLPPELRATAIRWQKTRILRSTGPDHVILGCSLAPSPHHFPPRAVYDTVSTVGAAMLLQLALGAVQPRQSLPLRGGIDVAAGSLVQPENFIYSPALTRAYELESEKAVFPRTVAGDRFIYYLNSLVNGAGSSYPVHRRAPRSPATAGAESATLRLSVALATASLTSRPQAAPWTRAG